MGLVNSLWLKLQYNWNQERDGVTMKKENRKWKAQGVLLLCILSLNIESGMESCQWEQHLANPGRTGYVTCDGPEDSTILWKLSLAGETDTPPLVIGDTLFVLKKNSCAHLIQSSIMKINLYTGKVIGQMDSEEWTPYYRFFTDGTDVYLLGENTQFEDMLEIWRVDFDRQELLSVASIPGRCCEYQSRALILDNKIVYPSTPLICFSCPDFGILWSTDAILPDQETIGIENAVADEHHVFVITASSNERQIYAFHLNTGAVAWSHTIPKNLLEITLEESTLYMGREELLALDAETGKTLWKFKPRGVISCNLVIGQTSIFAADTENQLYALDKKTGREVWRTQWEGDPGWTSLVGGGRFLYCTSGHGEESRLICFQADNGERLWEYRFSSPIHTQPCLTQGILIVALLRGDIYAFATSPVLQETPPETTPPESEKPPETTPPTPPESEKPPETTPPTPPESTPPSESTLTPILVVGSLFSIGVFIVYFFIRKKH